MKKEFTNNEVLDLYDDLTSIKGLKGAKFNYAIAKNIDLLESQVKNFNKLKKNVDDVLTPFEEDKKKAIIPYIEMNGDSPRIVPHAADPTIGIYIFLSPEKEEEWNKIYLELKDKHKGLFEENKKQGEDLTKFLGEKSEYVPYAIIKDHIPDEILTEDMMKIMPLIAE